MSIIQFPTRRNLPGITVSSRVKALDEMQAMFERKLPRTAVEDLLASDPALTPPPPPGPFTEAYNVMVKKPEILRRGNAALKKLSAFIGTSQRRTVEIALRGEEGQWFMEKMEELAGIVEIMPGTHENHDGNVWLHYFSANYDAYILEKDTGAEDDGPEEFQSQAYGWARFAHMPECAETGYISLPEILANGAELDFHFEPCLLSTATARFDYKDATGDDCLKAPVSDSETTTSGEAASRLAGGNSDTTSATFTPTEFSRADDAAFPAVPGLEIIMERGEGPSIECRTPVTLHSWQAADEQLRLWARSIDGDYYDKTDVKVTLDGEEAWEYRFDLKACGTEGDGADFRTNLINRIRFYTGAGKPDWMKPDRYAACMKDITEETRTFAANLAARLEALPIRPEPPAPKSTGIFGGWELLSEQIPQGAILFIRLGDFYETFAHHAKTAAPILNVALTKRKLVPMCGIPVHAADSYIKRLLEADHAVMLASFDSATGKAIIDRTFTPPACHAPTGEGEAPDLAKRQQEFLAMEDGYQPGAIICSTWGWEQTNIDFYRIDKRSGLSVTLTPLRSEVTETQFMSGKRVPLDTPKDYATDHDVAWGNKDLENPKPSFRRKLKLDGAGKIGGLIISSGWAKIWDGQPMTCSWYA